MKEAYVSNATLMFAIKSKRSLLCLFVVIYRDFALIHLRSMPRTRVRTMPICFKRSSAELILTLSIASMGKEKRRLPFEFQEASRVMRTLSSLQHQTVGRPRRTLNEVHTVCDGFDDPVISWDFIIIHMLALIQDGCQHNASV